MPISLVLALGSIYGTFHYGPTGRSAATANECAKLKSLIISEEKAGKSEWNRYRDLADQFNALAPNSSQRAPIVESIAMSVIEVLGHDLTIYKEMQRYPNCLKAGRVDSLSGIIDEVVSAINFLNGSEAINGSYFDPSQGNWNTTYYAEYVSALDFLKGEKVSG